MCPLLGTSKHFLSVLFISICLIADDKITALLSRKTRQGTMSKNSILCPVGSPARFGCAFQPSRVTIHTAVGSCVVYRFITMLSRMAKPCACFLSRSLCFCGDVTLTRSHPKVLVFCSFMPSSSKVSSLSSRVGPAGGETGDPATALCCWPRVPRALESLSCCSWVSLHWTFTV